VCAWVIEDNQLIPTVWISTIGLSGGEGENETLGHLESVSGTYIEGMAIIGQLLPLHMHSNLLDLSNAIRATPAWSQ
jgi:hypothetical protein